MFIDEFVTDILKDLALYEIFVEDGPDKIGLIGDRYTPLKIKKDGWIGTMIYLKNTIDIEQHLFRCEKIGCCKFILGHEVGHIRAVKINPDSRACFHSVYDTE